MLIISPHLDDAVLSCGQLMAGRPDTVVATVFTGTPEPGAMLTSYDHSCGFADAAAAMRARWDEDALALHFLHAEPVHLGLLDHQYRELATDGPSDAEIVEHLAANLLELMARPLVSQVIGPLGLAHPDHLLVARAYRVALDLRGPIEAWVYEDMPSRVLWPEQVAAQLQWWEDVLPGADSGWDVELGFLGTGPAEAKEHAIDYYASQLWALNRHTVLVPERHHQLVRS